jgi:hypothetical protein
MLFLIVNDCYYKWILCFTIMCPESYLWKENSKRELRQLQKNCNIASSTTFLGWLNINNRVPSSNDSIDWISSAWCCDSMDKCTRSCRILLVRADSTPFATCRFSCTHSTYRNLKRKEEKLSLSSCLDTYRDNNKPLLRRKALTYAIHMGNRYPDYFPHHTR